MLSFEVKISDYQLEQIWNGTDFVEAIKDGVVDEFVNRLYNDDINVVTREAVKEIVKAHKQEIVEKVIQGVSEGVTEKILKQKAVIAETPKVSELKAINRENEKYFMELIDKAIAKKFK